MPDDPTIKRLIAENEMKLAESYSLRDWEDPDERATVEVTDRMYRACVLHFLFDDDLVAFDVWAGKFQIFCREGWEGPNDMCLRDFDIVERVRSFVAMGLAEEAGNDAKSAAEFKDFLIYILQTRKALVESLSIIDTAVAKGIARSSDGT